MNDNHFKYSPSVWIIPTALVLLMWFVFYVNISFSLHLNQFGIIPRSFEGLIGIFASPFLHNDLAHIANNSISIFVLSAALIYFYRDISLKVLFYGVLLSGFITWIIGRDSIHIGASGLVYVLFSFMFFKGIMTKYYRLVALSLTIIVIYGGMFWYIFPNEAVTAENISWEAHLAGLISGFVFAVRYETPDYQKETRYDWEQPEYNPEGDKFLERFDENGNFVNKPIEIEEDMPTVVVYDFVEKKNENK